jgi:hypothetical protein
MASWQEPHRSALERRIVAVWIRRLKADLTEAFAELPKGFLRVVTRLHDLGGRCSHVCCSTDFGSAPAATAVASIRTRSVGIWNVGRFVSYLPEVLPRQTRR